MTNRLKRTAAAATAIVMCLSAMVGSAFAASPSFIDVPESHWAYSYVERAASSGIVDGVGNNLFKPSSSLTAAQYLAMFHRTCVNGKPTTTSDDKYWYSPYYNYFVRANLLNGTTIVEDNLNGPISRNDMAQIIYNFYKRGSFPEDIDKMFSPASPEKIKDYSSIPEAYRSAVLWVYGSGVIQGDEKGNFNGAKAMNRAEAATVMVRLEDSIAEWEETQKDMNMEEVLEHSKTSLYDTYEKATYTDGRTYTKEYVEILKENAISGERSQGNLTFGTGAYEIPVTVNFNLLYSLPNGLEDLPVSHAKITAYVRGNYDYSIGDYTWTPIGEWVFDESTNLKDGDGIFSFLIPYENYVNGEQEIHFVIDDCYHTGTNWVYPNNGAKPSYKLKFDYDMCLHPDKVLGLVLDY